MVRSPIDAAVTHWAVSEAISEDSCGDNWELPSRICSGEDTSCLSWGSGCVSMENYENGQQSNTRKTRDLILIINPKSCGGILLRDGTNMYCQILNRTDQIREYGRRYVFMGRSDHSDTSNRTTHTAVYFCAKIFSIELAKSVDTWRGHLSCHWETYISFRDASDSVLLTSDL